MPGENPDRASLDALLIELDQRVERFTRRRGEPSLVGAVDAWVHRVDELTTIANTKLFQNVKRFEELLAHLEARHDGAGHGLRKLDYVLHCMGVLAERLYPAEQKQDPRTALPAILDVVWPLTSEEQILRLELAGLIGEPLWRAAWELYVLRIFAFRLVVARVYGDDEAAGNRLGERLYQVFEERVDGQEAPPNLEQFVDHRFREYSRIAKSGDPATQRPPAAFVAGAFAWYCRRTLDPKVRLIGAREFAIARSRLDSMVWAYRLGGSA